MTLTRTRLALLAAASAAVLTPLAAAQTSTLADSTIANFETAFEGTLTSASPSGCGYELNALATDNITGSAVALQISFASGELNLTGQSTLALDVTDVGGTLIDGRIYVQASDEFTFIPGTLTLLPDDVTTTLTFDLTGLSAPEISSIRRVGLQLFGNGGAGDVSVTARVEPVAGATPGIACVGYEDAGTFSQSQLLTLGQNQGVSYNIAASGRGVVISGEPEDTGPGTRLSGIVNFSPLLDFSQFPGITHAALKVTRLAGNATGTRITVREQGGSFNAGPTVSGLDQVRSSVTICLDLATISNLANVSQLGVNFFGPDTWDGTDWEFLVEPVLCAVDTQPPGPCDDFASETTLLQGELFGPSVSFGSLGVPGAVDGAGVRFTGTSTNRDNGTSGDPSDDFSQTTIQYPQGMLDLSAPEGLSFFVTDNSGTINSARVVIKTGPAFVFAAGPTVDIPSGLPTKICFDLTLLPDFVVSDTREIQIDLFSDAGGPAVDFTVTPLLLPDTPCNPADLVAPFGLITLDDFNEFEILFADGCDVIEATFQQDVLDDALLAFPDSPRGTLDMVTPDQDGVLLDFTTNSTGDNAVFFDVADLDLSAFNVFALDVEQVAGGYFNTKLFFQTDSGLPDPDEPTEPLLTFSESDLVDIQAGNTRVEIDLTNLIDFGGNTVDLTKVARIGFQFFGPDGQANSATQIRVTPADAAACSPIDFAPPFGELEFFDYAFDLNLIGIGCQ